MIKAVLFDLDGTLLPMEEEKFLKSYLSLLSKHVEAKGYDSNKLIGAIWQSFDKAVHNDGKKSNEDVFWDSFASILGSRVLDDRDAFDVFYTGEFNKAQPSCGFDPRANKTIKDLKRAGLDVILATNPVFPRAATLNRARWAGLDKEDFLLITTYEESHFCKPNVKYYEEILSKCDLRPEECIMIGNDAEEDMVARDVGLSVFLLTDCLINRKNVDINEFPHGSYDEMWKFLYDKLDGRFSIKGE